MVLSRQLLKAHHPGTPRSELSRRARLAPPAFVEPEIPAELSLPATPAHVPATLPPPPPASWSSCGMGSSCRSLARPARPPRRRACRVGSARRCCRQGRCRRKQDKDPRCRAVAGARGVVRAGAGAAGGAVLLEAIRGGLSPAGPGSSRPLALTWQLSEQAAEQIESICSRWRAAPARRSCFHDITRGDAADATCSQAP